MKRRFISVLAIILCLGLLGPMWVMAEEEDEEEEEDPVAVVTIIPAEGEQAELGVADESILIEADGLKFKDLNKNDQLDPYEDWRLGTEERVADLLSRMEPDEKAFQMLHMTLVTLKESWFNENNVGFVLAYTYLADGIEAAVQRGNYVQALSEESRLGIPVVFSMDSVIGCSWIDETTIIPDQITLAATGDVELVGQLAVMQREEMKALGVRMSLSPTADLATDPRWGRAQECFGEDAELASAMIKAAVQGLQAGDKLTPDSVIACVKHFPGSGPQTNGEDGSPIVLNDDSIDMHLSVFKAAIEAGAASIMPYGYSTVPYLGGDAVDNFAHESSVVMNDLLRNDLGYEGIIQTDWGTNHTAAALAGADALGGAGARESKKLVEALSEEQLNEKVGKLLAAKFELGIFENPYSDLETAQAVVGTEENYALAKRAAAEALTLVKYENPVELAGRNIIVAGTLADDAAALNSGWKIPNDNYEFERTTGDSILEGIIKEAGEDKVTFIGNDTSLIPESVGEDTVAILVVGEKSGTHQPNWGAQTLEFPAEQQELAAALKAAGAYVVTVVVMNRAYVLSPIAEQSDSVLLVYRPGMTAGAEAVADALFGKAAITGHTPFQIPADMNQVLSQREDLAKDITDPLYDYGFGIETESFGK
ncbi:MAG: glycoside hydrolase family 3 C-terminal domain-containing protein [Parasporobacterium sp.]|nr:glycoside hydrolase family 3 C-terminal domain-containing protein [Parasporobacterium sp.]